MHLPTCTQLYRRSYIFFPALTIIFHPFWICTETNEESHTSATRDWSEIIITFIRSQHCIQHWFSEKALLFLRKPTAFEVAKAAFTPQQDLLRKNCIYWTKSILTWWMLLKTWTQSSACSCLPWSIRMSLFGCISNKKLHPQHTIKACSWGLWVAHII